MNQNPKDFTLHELGVVLQSKKELYDLLTIECGYYLPTKEQANADYISDILNGDKIVNSLFWSLSSYMSAWSPQKST